MSTFNELIDFTRSTTGTYLDSVVYGDELVTNGDFSNGTTGWNFRTETPESGRARLNNTSLGNITYYNQTAVGEVGKAYVLTYDVLATNGATLVLQQATDLPLDTTTTGSKRLTFNWSRVGGALTIKRLTSNTDVTIDNISVKEVLYDRPDGTLQLLNHPINKPRIEYDAEGNCLGLLVEEGRTNSQANSENINAAWSQKASGRTEVLSNQITAPDGTSSADLIQAIDGSSAGEQYARRYISSIPSTNTLSVFVKKKNWRYIALRLIGNRVFDFDTEAFTMGSGTIQKLPNGWYRLSVTDAAGGPAYIGVGTASSANAIPWATAPQNNEGVYLWGAQIETGSFPTSYIPTSGSAVTRSADVASLAVSEFGYNQDQGSFVIKFDYNDPQNVGTKFLLSSTSSSRFAYTNGNTSTFYSYDGVTSLNYGSLSGDGTQYILATGMDSAGSVGVVNGGTLSTSTATPQDNVSTNIYIGSSAGTNQFLSAHIKSIQYYPLRLSNAQLQALTS